MNLKKFNITALFIVFLLNISTAAAAIVEGGKDAVIIAEVKAKLLEANDIPAKDIRVEAKDGVVELQGVLDTSLQVSRVVEIAAGVNNVTDVVAKDLKTKDSRAPLTDALITAKAKGTIFNLSLTNKISTGSNLHVETTNQKVHVDGTVDNKNDIETVKKALLNIKDVKAVDVNIEARK